MSNRLSSSYEEKLHEQLAEAAAAPGSQILAPCVPRAIAPIISGRASSLCREWGMSRAGLLGARTRQLVAAEGFFRKCIFWSIPRNPARMKPNGADHPLRAPCASSSEIAMARCDLFDFHRCAALKNKSRASRHSGSTFNVIAVFPASGMAVFASSLWFAITRHRRSSRSSCR